MSYILYRRNKCLFIHTHFVRYNNNRYIVHVANVCIYTFFNFVHFYHNNSFDRCIFAFGLSKSTFCCLILFWYQNRYFWLLLSCFALLRSLQFCIYVHCFVRCTMYKTSFLIMFLLSF